MEFTEEDYKQLEVIFEIQKLGFTQDELSAVISGFLLTLNPDPSAAIKTIQHLREAYDQTIKEIQKQMQKENHS